LAFGGFGKDFLGKNTFFIENDPDLGLDFTLNHRKWDFQVPKVQVG